MPVKEKILEENKMFKKLKNKKGFTLVELIVVLVILAILAALLVPALTGYIDKAHEQSLTSEASMVLTAAQATVSEAYGTGDIKLTNTGTNDAPAYTVAFKDAAAKTAAVKQINELAELKSGASWTFNVKVVDGSATYKKVVVDTLVYSNGTNSIVYSLGTDNVGSWGSTKKNTPLANATPEGYAKTLDTTDATQNG